MKKLHILLCFIAFCVTSSLAAQNIRFFTFEKPEKPKSDVEISVSIYKKTTYSKNTAPKKGKK